MLSELGLINEVFKLVFSEPGLMDRTLCEKKNYTGSWDGIYLNVNDIDSRERSDMCF